MDVSILLVSYNAQDHIAECLRSIREHTTGIEYEVIVSDNASTDGTVEMIRQEFPWVRVVENGKNLGFGTANNRGVRVATGRTLIFLNTDTRLTDNLPQRAHAYIQNHPDVGCAGVRFIFPNGRHQDTVRAYPQWTDQALILLKLHHVFPHARALRRYMAVDIDYSREQDVDQVMGACMIIPREVFFSVHGFDEQFFLWFEEVDLQKRIREAGMRIVYAPLSTLVHLKGATFRKNLAVRNQRYFNESVRTYFRKHDSVLHASVIAVCTWAGLVLAYGVQWIALIGVDMRSKKNAQL